MLQRSNRRVFGEIILFTVSLLLAGISSIATSFGFGFYEPPPLIPISMVSGSLIIYWVIYVRLMIIFPQVFSLDSQSEIQQGVLMILKIILFIMSITLTCVFLFLLQQNLRG